MAWARSGTTRRTWIQDFVSKWHPTMNLATECAEKVRVDTSLKRRYHRHGIYKMELIFVQTRVKGRGSPELALVRKKKED